MELNGAGYFLPHRRHSAPHFPISTDPEPRPSTFGPSGPFFPMACPGGSDLTSPQAGPAVRQFPGGLGGDPDPT